VWPRFENGVQGKRPAVNNLRPSPSDLRQYNLRSSGGPAAMSQPPAHRTLTQSRTPNLPGGVQNQDE
jgi:hypothetical protein